jgi:hypothetical protein
MKMQLIGAALVGGLLGTSNAQAESTLFSDDFATSPLTNGKWTVARSGNPRAAHDASGQSFYLTQVGGDMSGISMFANTPLETRRWEASFRYRIGGLYQGGADGLVFLFYKKGGYTPGYGGFLGFNPPYAPQPGYGIAIDNYYNSGWDPSGSYIGLISNTTYTFSDKLAYANDRRTEDGVWHSMKVRFIDGDVSVYVDGGLLFTHKMAAPNYTYDGVGFSAGIGADQNYHQIDDFVLTDLEEPVWTSTGRMNLEHGLHTATKLASGKVLVVGGYNSSAELYDPATGTWSFTGSASTSRLRPTATPLKDGRVLVTGGENDSHSLASAEVYDPATGSWSATGDLGTGRRDHTATPLSDGRVLVTGGYNESSGALSSAEVYDPTTGTWTPVGFLSQARSQHQAVALPNGRVLVVGGQGADGMPLSSAEVYDPSTRAWSPVGSLGTGRRYHTATVMKNGRVLVAGGYDANASVLASAEVYDPATGAWSSTASLGKGRRYHTATALGDGRVLVSGGYSEWYGILGSAEVYDPATGTWSDTVSMGLVRYHHTATLLNDGRVLSVGGFSTGDQASAELYGSRN